MDINEITKILDSLPTGRSDYEFEHFFLESQPTPARQIVSVMREIEFLHSEVERLSSEQKTEGQLDVRRLIIETTQKLDQAVAWFDNIDPDMRNAIISEYSAQEGEYWSNYLGRQAAIELLTIGKTTKETMNRMSCLPVESFEDAVRICVRYASLIKNTTAAVEETLGINTDGIPNG
jgi:hypothetical protein